MPFTVLFATVLLLSRSTKKLFCGAQHRGTKPPPGGINGFNAVKARRDGIERIQEVSESPARLDFAALQSFSTHAPPKKRRRTTQKPKTTSKRRRFLLFFQHPIRHLPNQRLRQLIPKLNLFWQGILCNMLFAIIHNLSLCFLSGRNTGL